MNKITTYLMIVLMALCVSLISTMPSKAQSNTNMTGVIPFMSNDRLGFFDQRTGAIYVYDSNFSNCLFVGQVQELGKPIQTITKTNTQSVD